MGAVFEIGLTFFLVHYQKLRYTWNSGFSSLLFTHSDNAIENWSLECLRRDKDRAYGEMYPPFPPKGLASA